MQDDLTKLDSAQLQTEIDLCTARASALRAELGKITIEFQDNIRVETARATALSAELLRRKRKHTVEPALSDHALIRYIERVKGIDLDSVRAHIMSPTICDAIRAGAVVVKVDGVKFLVNNGVLTTVVLNKTKAQKKPPRMYEDKQEHDT